ncbi:hypothetical protein HJC23_003511 [Cyclotella cryptica]|uniref:Uncharacterized protein n=1 Tax=Cyclotella cryptica TaxID=29204 RepID=A0ABD3PAG5_9STRA|eukprot:CCRYP_016361-RA/>CCRYP_016361-RA protein AED:0.28 eAED:0.28 QI:0/-1/0/1/-1/1/1/0/213
MPSHVASKTRDTQVTFVKNPFNEYNIFLALEHERNLKLKEVYQSRCITAIVNHDEQVYNKDDHGPSSLPSYPPRYHNLHFPVEWFITKLQHPRRPLPTKASAQAWKSLDQMSMVFLRDLSVILMERYNENYTKGHTPTETPTFFRSTTVTPPASPSRRQNDGIDALLWAAQLAPPPLPSLSDADDSNKKLACTEVDMSDYEIRGLWANESGIQ